MFQRVANPAEPVQAHQGALLHRQPVFARELVPASTALADSDALLEPPGLLAAQLERPDAMASREAQSVQSQQV